MQTAEYRHLTKNQKNAISRPTRKHHKRAMAKIHEEIGKCGSEDVTRKETLLAERRKIIKQLNAA